MPGGDYKFVLFPIYTSQTGYLYSYTVEEYFSLPLSASPVEERIDTVIAPTLTPIPTPIPTLDLINPPTQEPADNALVSIEEWEGISSEALELIFEDDENKYYLTSIRSHHIMLTFENGERISLRETISQQKVGLDELLSNGLEVYTEKK